MGTMFDSNGSITPNGTSPVVLFDATHGQPNWAQTGFPSREMHSNFAGVMQALCHLGCTCTTINEKPLGKFLPRARLLVVPPPTGRYNPRKERWDAHRTSLFTAEEVQDILEFLRNGGRLLAFAYRFGDSFTQANLRDLFGPLGCILNNDAVIDITTLRTSHPLQTCFDTPADFLPLPWCRPRVEQVRWRSMATFVVLPGAAVQPLAFSPASQCVTFDQVHRRISFGSLPIAVAGSYHRGRFVLFGGPHPFETGTFGLLAETDNACFLKNILQWLLEDHPDGVEPLRVAVTPPAKSRVPGFADRARALSHLDGGGNGWATVASVECLLRKTGALQALSMAKWMP